jgi:type I restriction enzyme, R subunit
MYSGAYCQHVPANLQEYLRTERAVIDKNSMSERDICTKFITPALKRAGWDELTQIREEVSFTKGRIIVRGKLVTRGKAKRADYVLYYKNNIPIALIEAKDNNDSVGDGMQQGLEYAETLEIPFVFSSNGDGFIFHDRTGGSAEKEADLGLDAFPSPANLWMRYAAWKGLTSEAEQLVLQDYFDDGSGKAPRYYQVNAVNAAIEAIAKGRDRILLVMATGTGKTYTAFQIIWRLWKAGRKKRILYLADRNVLIDETMVNDFRPFGAAMAKLSTNAKTIERADGSTSDLPLALDKKRRIDTAFEIYLGLYQAITGPEERQKLFKEFSRGFFDLIIIDECHRGSAAEDSAWREILEYFSEATQIGLTATPKETKTKDGPQSFAPGDQIILTANARSKAQKEAGLFNNSMGTITAIAEDKRGHVVTVRPFCGLHFGFRGAFSSAWAALTSFLSLGWLPRSRRLQR